MKKLKSLSEQVCDYVIRKIKLGELTADEKLSDTDLIEQLQISRTPIREALIQLAADGVLENIPRKGFFIKNFDREETIATYRIIARLDAYAAELAMNVIQEDVLKDMETVIRRMDLDIEQENYELYTDDQEAFHDIYLEICGNQQLIELIHSLQKKYIRTTATSNDKKRLFEFFLETNDDHRLIVQFLRDKNLDALVSVVINHWQRVLQA